jgi:hypothetical protein
MPTCSQKIALEGLVSIANTCGLGGLSPPEMDGLVAALAAALAANIERDLQLAPPINPDRRYSLAEIQKNGYGPKRGRFYKAHKHLIRKDGRASYVLGRDLLALRDAAPTVATCPTTPVVRRPRGRPRKVVGRGAGEVVADQVQPTGQ